MKTYPTYSWGKQFAQMYCTSVILLVSVILLSTSCVCMHSILQLPNIYTGSPRRFVNYPKLCSFKFEIGEELDRVHFSGDIPPQ